MYACMLSLVRTIGTRLQRHTWWHNLECSLRTRGSRGYEDNTRTDNTDDQVLVGGGGSVVRACDWQSSGRGFESCWGRLENLAISFTPLCQCLSEDTLKAAGPFYLVSMPGEVQNPTSLHWKCVICREIHHPLLETTRHHGPHWK